MRGRLGTLQLNWRQEYQNGNKDSIETLEHFLVHCKHYDDLKEDFNIMNTTSEGNMAQMLLLKDTETDSEKIKNLLSKMYNRRRAAQKRREEEQHRI